MTSKNVETASRYTRPCLRAQVCRTLYACVGVLCAREELFLLNSFTITCNFQLFLQQAIVARSLWQQIKSCSVYSCITVWSNSSLTTLKPLISIHKQIIRSFSSAAFREHTQPMMYSLGLLNLNQIYTYMSCNYVLNLYPPELCQRHFDINTR